METKIIEGGCFCGEVRYRVTGPPAWVGGVCHCYTCRLTSGAPFVAFVNFHRHDFSFVKGQPIYYRYIRDRADPGRPWGQWAFCGSCGTQIYHTNNDDPEKPKKWVSVATCTLDNPEAFPPRHWEGGDVYKLSWVQVPGNKTRAITPVNIKEQRKWQKDVIPLISSDVAGPLGVLHLPRFWCKVLLQAKGLLHTDYGCLQMAPEWSDGFDLMVLEGLGLNRQETLTFLRTNLPSYPEFERWILEKKGFRLNPETVEQLNAKIQGYVHDDETHKSILEAVGMEDDSSIQDAVTLNNLDDWMEFHRIVTSGAEVTGDKTNKTVITGGCHCGAVRYRSTKALCESPSICHCSNCRRASAAPFVAFVPFTTDGFSFIKGEPIRYRYTSEMFWEKMGRMLWSERWFCGRCGTQLVHIHEGLTDDTDESRILQLSVTTCSLDDPEAIPPKWHESPEEKLSWVELWPLGDSK